MVGGSAWSAELVWLNLRNIALPVEAVAARFIPVNAMLCRQRGNQRYGRRSPQSGETDLNALDDYLMSDHAPGGCMGLSEVDGFLTGIVVGPELPSPSTERMVASAQVSQVARTVTACPLAPCRRCWGRRIAGIQFTARRDDRLSTVSSSKSCIMGTDVKRSRSPSSSH